MNGEYSPQFPLLRRKQFRLILKLAAAGWTRMLATEAAFEVKAVQSEQGIDRISQP
jgi:hypothetical protein